MSDPELLQSFVRENSQPAFAELVARHVNLVYSAALRQVPAPHLAEEVAQAVFLDLARQAARLPADRPLAPWLYVVTRRTAIDLVRREARRVAREQHAAELAAMQTPPSNWSRLAGSVDEAMETLNDAERSAIVLRFFENRSLREVGATLGISEDTAQKRVSRALERLRAFFLQRGIAVSAAALATDLSAHAVGAAPATLSATIAGASALPAAASLEATRIVAMTTLQKSLAVTALVLVGGAGAYEATLLARQSSELDALRLANERAGAELQARRRERDATTAQLQEVERQIDARLAAAAPRSPEDIALETRMQEWLGRVDTLRGAFARRPEWSIPELQLLTDNDWFNAASSEALADEDSIRRACSRLRNQADSRAANRIMQALRVYANAHGGQLPSRPADLAPHLDPPLDPAIDTAMLARYEMLRTGPAMENGNGVPAIAVRRPVDLELDTYTTIAVDNYGHSGSAMNYDVNQAQRRYQRENGGQRATLAAQLMPYLKWPVEPDRLQRYLAERGSRK